MTGGALGALMLAAAAGAVLPAGRSVASRLSHAGPSAPVAEWGPVTHLRRVALLARRRQDEQALREQLGDLLLALAAELRGGADSRAAMAAAAQDLPRLCAVATAARMPAGDVAQALDSLAGQAGGRAGAELAFAWRVAERTGCPLAEPVARLHASLRHEEALRREVQAQLAGPRATARLLAALPVLGVLLGIGLGADPLAFLLGAPAGRLCLVAGAALSVLGLLWTGRIAGAVLAPEAR